MAQPNKKTLRFPIALHGGSGSGKTTACVSFARAFDATVICCDTGSYPVYEVNCPKLVVDLTSAPAIAKALKEHKISSREGEIPLITAIRGLIEKAQAEGRPYVLDNWAGLELAVRESFKASAKRANLSIRDQGTIVGQLRDLVLHLAGIGGILVVNTGDGQRIVNLGDGQQTITPPGQIVCSPSLREPQPFLASFALVLAVCRGGSTKGGEEIPRGIHNPYKDRRPDEFKANAPSKWMFPAPTGLEQEKVWGFDKVSLADLVNIMNNYDPTKPAADAVKAPPADAVVAP